MPTLSAYSNSENTALVILKELGYQYWADEDHYCCEKDGWDFRAHSFVELLGLIQIFEYHSPKEYKENWWKINDPWLLSEVSNQAPEFNSIMKIK